MKSFAFDLGQVVKLVQSGETGIVKGRAEYTTQENQYWVRYKDANNCQVERWWGESDIEAQ